MRRKFLNIKRNEDGSLSFALAFFLLSAILIFFFAVATQVLIMLNVEFMSAGEDILNSSETVLADIDNVGIHDTIQDSIDNAQSGVVDNITVLGFFFQYAYIFIIVIVAMVLFVIARQSVETNIG
jgi:hypothetical protein